MIIVLFYDKKKSSKLTRFKLQFNYQLLNMALE